MCAWHAHTSGVRLPSDADVIDHRRFLDPFAGSLDPVDPFRRRDPKAWSTACEMALATASNIGAATREPCRPRRSCDAPHPAGHRARDRDRPRTAPDRAGARAPTRCRPHDAARCPPQPRRDRVRHTTTRTRRQHLRHYRPDTLALGTPHHEVRASDVGDALAMQAAREPGVAQVAARQRTNPSSRRHLRQLLRALSAATSSAALRFADARLHVAVAELTRSSSDPVDSS